VNESCSNTIQHRGIAPTNRTVARYLATTKPAGSMTTILQP
jgi:hypothetical protein